MLALGVLALESGALGALGALAQIQLLGAGSNQPGAGTPPTPCTGGALLYNDATGCAIVYFVTIQH